MDSTGNVDRHNGRVFLLMTHCVARGVPVGCFLTTPEMQSTIEAALRIYKELLSPDSFNGRGVRGPCMMTAMPREIPSERPFQTLWYYFARSTSCRRWLWDAKFEILHGDRHDLFHLFKRLMYADSCEKLDELYEAGIQSDVVKRYPRFAAYLSLQYTCKDLWALC